MKSIYNTPGFSEELLLVCASLREVGLRATESTLTFSSTCLVMLSFSRLTNCWTRLRTSGICRRVLSANLRIRLADPAVDHHPHAPLLSSPGQ